MSKRTQFMLEAIYDLKNNKSRNKKNSGGKGVDVAGMEHVKKLKRWVGHLASKVGQSKSEAKSVGSTTTTLVPLRASLDDLCDAETKGRWWVAGAPWQQRKDGGGGASGGVGGGAAGGGGRSSNNQLSSLPASASLMRNADVSDERWAALERAAVAQRMSSGIQKTVFCVLMSSGDYLDAFERLLKLNLKDKQERSIVHVLVHCCAQEKAHNPFYAHLAEKLCGMGHHFKFTFQLTFWDRLKLMKGDEDMADPMPLRKVANLARLLAHLLVQFSMSLAILKVVEWDRLTDTEISFLRMVFLKVRRRVIIYSV